VAITAGGLCSPDEIVFHCPWWNTDPDYQPLIVGYDWQLKCQVCGMKSTVLTDADVRRGYLLLDLQFGPNFREGDFYEDDVLSYQVFVADTSGNRISDEVAAEIARHEALPDSESMTCCIDNYYTVRVNAEIPDNISQVLLEIVPVTSSGPAYIGVFTSILKDTVGGVTAGALRHAPLRSSFALAVAMILALVH